MIGTWRGFARGARVTIPVVVVTALVQAVLVIGDPTPEGTWGFTLRAVASVVAVIVALWLVVWAAASAVRPGATFSMPPASRPP
ncbi:MAG TPA: hypothetical protein PKC36_06695, partial [Dietzia sp.]|nr:hypothetical protein [Dietzia sp.]